MCVIPPGICSSERPTKTRSILSHKREPGRRILAAVEDLLFRSRISEAATSLGIEAKFPRSPKKLLEAVESETPDLVILDLNSERFDALSLLGELSSVRTLGYLSHVQKDLAVAARAAGCDKIVARSAFVAGLPQILETGSGGDA